MNCIARWSCFDGPGRGFLFTLIRKQPQTPMATARKQAPAIRFAAIFSQDIRAIDWACAEAARHWGEIVERTDDLPFDMTTYYNASMGGPLRKRLVAFEQLIDPSALVASKTLANQWEAEYQKTSDATVERALNIDPGYLTEAKVVLATMKDRDHRLYLGSGVFGEVTLFFQLPGKWVSSRWTYPDFRTVAYHEFFDRCRARLRRCLQQPGRDD